MVPLRVGRFAKLASAAPIPKRCQTSWAHPIAAITAQPRTLFLGMAIQRPPLTTPIIACQGCLRHPATSASRGIATDPPARVPGDFASLDIRAGNAPTRLAASRRQSLRPGDPRKGC